MHEYYLTGSNGQGVFDFPLQTDRLDFLFEQFRNDAPTINSNLEFLVPEPLKPQFSNYSLKVIPSYSGFKLAVKCNREILPDGRIVFTPLIKIPDTEELLIGVKEMDSIQVFSNLSLSSPFRRIWYFSNDKFPFPKSFPFLSGPVADFDPANNYAQGELALFDPADVRIFLNNGTVDPWLPLPGGNYISDTDRMIVPLSFTYHFSAADNVTDAVFSLTDNNGIEIKKTDLAGTDVLRTVALNFRLPGNPILALPGVTPSTQSLYTLTVTSSNGYARSFKLIFADDSIGITQYTAIIGLRLKSLNAAFNLTDNDGYLQTRIQSNGIKIDPPVFELWMKSSLVYWQYRNNRQKKIKLTPDTQDLLADEDGILISKEPQQLSYAPFLLKKPDNSFQYLPNPAPGDQVKTVDSRLYVNIIVPASKMFPLV
jgi:hypothetical protein